MACKQDFKSSKIHESFWHTFLDTTFLDNYSIAEVDCNRQWQKWKCTTVG